MFEALSTCSFAALAFEPIGALGHEHIPENNTDLLLASWPVLHVRLSRWYWRAFHQLSYSPIRYINIVRVYEDTVFSKLTVPATSETFSTIVLEAGNDAWKSRALRALAPNARVERRADEAICESILGGLEERIVSGIPHPLDLYIPHP